MMNDEDLHKKIDETLCKADTVRLEKLRREASARMHVTRGEVLDMMARIAGKTHPVVTDYARVWGLQ